MRSTRFRVAVSSVLLLAGLAEAEVRPPAELIAFQGRVEVREPDAESWQPARLMHPLLARSTVRSGEASWASILFIDQTQIKLSANALFQVKEIAGRAAGKTIIEMRRGKAWTRSKAAPARLIMQTPAVNAGIEGTDWVVEVARDGTTRLSVLSGEIHCYNDQGEVWAGRGEEVLAVPGKAPVKRPLVNPRERVQWVGTHAIQWEKYPELRSGPAAGPLVADIRDGRITEALSRLEEGSHGGCSASERLLAADLAWAAGDLPGAEARLAAGGSEYPEDPRFPAELAELALLRDREAEAAGLIDRGLERFPGSAELWLAKGDLARWQGERALAVSAYERAARLAPGDPRPRLGLGRVAEEREDYPGGRQALVEALELSPGWSEALAELGWLSALSDDLEAARGRLEAAVAADPADYVALTGLGYLELKSGHPEMALEHLLAANTIEPSYARAVLTMGIAYYQLGRLKAALDSLTRASELDPRDPMPWLLLSLIHQDQWQPGEAVEAAEQGMQRLPYLRSVNQLANDLRGSANLGSAYALFGLEDWAMRMAQDSYDPFWAGSHFFLADRYVGEFERNSELTLGFLTDPTAFGTRGLWQPLLPVPGFHGGASYWHDQGRDERIDVPAMRLNSYHNRTMPFAWLMEGQYQSWEDEGLDADAEQFTLGLGLKPDPVLRLFLFANEFSPDIRQEITGGEQRISGHNRRIDGGFALRHGPESQSWLKAGHTGERSSVEGPNLVVPSTQERTELNPQRDDVELRHSRRLSDGLELSLGAEWARRQDDADYWLWSQPVATPSSSGQDRSKDKSTLGYVSAKLRPIADLSLQADLSYTRVETDTSYKAQIGSIDLDRGDYHELSKRLQPGLGTVLRPAAHWTLRGALKDWTRPVSFNTLSPIATAGIPVDAVNTLPGGRLEQVRLQVERQTDRALSEAWLDHRKIRNIAFDPLAGPDNGATELADLSRLDPQDRQSLALDFPEGLPLFSRGEIREWGLSHEQVLSRTLSVYSRYRHADSENTGWFEGNELPYLPDHQGTLGMTWFPAPRWNLQARADYRTERFADEANTQRLAPGWDATLLASWQSYRKDLQADVYLSSLLDEDRPTSVGAALSIRF